MSQNKDLWVNSPVDTFFNAGDNPGGNHPPDDLITLLCGSLAVLWKDWPNQMRCTLLDANTHWFSQRCLSALPP